MAAVTRLALARCFWRSLWLQASWSFEGMQSLGFAYAMEPALDRIYGSGGELRRAATARHLEFFNSHPVLAAAILGASVRMEEERGAEGAADVVRLKRTLMGAYGGLGDSLYWGALKPALILASLHAAYRGWLWAPWAFLAAFLAVNLGGRLAAFAVGYRSGEGVVAAVGRLDLLGWARRLKALSAVLLGALLSLSARATPLGSWEVPVWLWGSVGVCLVWTAAWCMGRGLRPEWAVCAAAAVSAVLVLWT